MENNWVAPRMTDGLGNRLFQISAAISVAEKMKRKTIILLPRYLKIGHGVYDLVFQLCPQVPVIETANSWIQVDEKLEIPETDKGIVLKGYFQNTNYFPDWKHPLLPKLPEQLLKPVTNKVAIHFRFGDYCFLHHHTLPFGKYYMKAINQFPKDTEFLLFSDSPEKLIPIEYELLAKGYSVSCAEPMEVLETLLEIASCAGGFIGGNSTFSWWSAFLSWKSQNFSSKYIAYFPDIWMPQYGESPENKPNLFTLPFTKSLNLDGESKLETFTYR